MPKHMQCIWRADRQNEEERTHRFSFAGTKQANKDKVNWNNI